MGLIHAWVQSIDSYHPIDGAPRPYRYATAGRTFVDSVPLFWSGRKCPALRTHAVQTCESYIHTYIHTYIHVGAVLCHIRSARSQSVKEKKAQPKKNSKQGASNVEEEQKAKKRPHLASQKPKQRRLEDVPADDRERVGHRLVPHAQLRTQLRTKHQH